MGSILQLRLRLFRRPHGGSRDPRRRASVRVRPACLNSSNLDAPSSSKKRPSLLRAHGFAFQMLILRIDNCTLCFIAPNTVHMASKTLTPTLVL